MLCVLIRILSTTQPHLLQLHSFLKSIYFNNSARDQVYLGQQRISEKQYDILNFWNFPDGLGLQVKVGQFVPQAPPGQDFSIYEELIDWAIRFKEVGCWIFMTLRYLEQSWVMSTLVTSSRSTRETERPPSSLSNFLSFLQI